VVPCVTAKLQEQVLLQIDDELELDIITYVGDARNALIACDVALAKAGTVTLEAALMRRPMVVAYKIGQLTYQILRFLVKTNYFSLPNIIADKRLVPEFIQKEASPENLAISVCSELERFENDPEYLEGYKVIYDQLRKNANQEAATAFYSLLD
jgi:lipid-A-disaccharide synthase